MAGAGLLALTEPDFTDGQGPILVAQAKAATEGGLIAMQILHAGHGSTIDVLGSGMVALLDHPDQATVLAQRLIEDGPAHAEGWNFGFGGRQPGAPRRRARSPP